MKHYDGACLLHAEIFATAGMNLVCLLLKHLRRVADDVMNWLAENFRRRPKKNIVQACHLERQPSDFCATDN